MNYACFFLSCSLLLVDHVLRFYLIPTLLRIKKIVTIDHVRFLPGRQQHYDLEKKLI